MPRELAPCGTRTAYKRHQRRGEPVDEACRAANAEYQRSKSGRAQDEEQSAPIVALPGGSVEMPIAPKGDVDARAELLANMALVKKAMEALVDADPMKIVTLSKRHSELVDELVKVSGTAPAAASGEADPFAFLGIAARGPAPAPRKSS
ncbi:hypothetical protein K8F61_05215 [Microbacterium resistens]|uniref:Terminase small subunit n=1 Tax=Microbacterium resistens TaxID=156977 RepID=A0ABY3RX72_9MICO|nr:hypothetical protein [Microbacterium resistens]UGS27590.1 hypothetical protein K8F61_05215 [Microbacterium resistens]